MVKVVLVGRRHSNVFGVNDLYFINQNHKRVKPENILLEITIHIREISFLCMQFVWNG